MQVIGLLGGTFNPPHKGHMRLACYAKQQLNLDRVLLIPCRKPPHKTVGDSIDGVTRCELVRKSLVDYDGLELSTIEQNLPVPSYSIDTIKALLKNQPASYVLIIGWDQWVEFKGWKAFKEILKLAKLAVCRRPGVAEQDFDGHPDILEQFADRVEFLDMPLMDISSEQVRQRVKQGIEIGDMVEQQVEEMILESNLYEEGFQFSSKKLAELCVRLADEAKAKDAVIIDLQGKTIIADYFVILTVNNDRHSYAVVRKIVDEVKKTKRKLANRDGTGDSGWVLMDLGDVVVHIFTDHVRKRYDLEELWKECDFILDQRL